MSRRRTLAAVGLTTLGLAAAAAAGYASGPTQTAQGADRVVAASYQPVTARHRSMVPDHAMRSMGDRETRAMMNSGEMRRHMHSPRMRHMHQMMMGDAGRDPGTRMGGMSKSRRHHRQ